MKKMMKTPDSAITIIAMILIIIGIVSMVTGEVIDLLRSHGILPEEASEYASTSIDWAERYPVKASLNEESTQLQEEAQASAPVESAPRRRTVLDRFYNLTVKLDRLEADMEQHFLFRRHFLEFSGYVNRFLGKTDFGEAHQVAKLDNGHLAFVYQWNGYNKEQIDRQAVEISSFSQWLNEQEIPFFYVQVPTKIDKYDSNAAYKEVNQNNDYYDYYIQQLQLNGIDVLDLRETFHNSPKYYYDYFFKTDEHWTLEAGKYAAVEIALKINEVYPMANLDPSILDDSRFTPTTYERLFLGALGRKVTLGYADPDDFTIFYPNFKTDFHVVAPDKEIDLSGPFEDVMFDKALLSTKDYYGFSIYEAISHGNRPLLQVTNRETGNTLKVLFIRDSFSLAVIPYFSMMARQSDWIDVRPTNGNFNGSLKTYIDETKPDVVILMHDLLEYHFQ